MTQSLFSLKNAGLLFILSAILMLVLPFASGFSIEPLPYFVAGILWGMTGMLLASRGWRWMAWLAFLAVLVASIASYIMSANAGMVTSWIFIAITLVNVLAVLVLFVVLWRPKAAHS